MLVRKGAVSVNGRTARNPEQKVDPREDVVSVNGRTLIYKEYLYILMNKPQGVVSASSDPRQRTVLDLLPASLRRRGLFPVGRLDKDTTGLLLITDDGEFAHKLMSPKKEVYKTYVARLDGPVGEREVEAFAQGLVLKDGTQCRPAVLLLPKDGSNTATVRICEGMYHQVKRLFEAVGRKVHKKSKCILTGYQKRFVKSSQKETKKCTFFELLGVLHNPQKQSLGN